MRGTIFRGRKNRLFSDYRALQNIMRVSDPKLHKQYGRAVCNFDAIVWEHERENLELVGSYAKFTQNPACNRIFWVPAIGCLQKLAYMTPSRG